MYKVHLQLHQWKTEPKSTIYLDGCPEFALSLSDEEEGLSVLIQEQEDNLSDLREDWRYSVIFCSLMVIKRNF